MAWVSYLVLLVAMEHDLVPVYEMAEVLEVDLSSLMSLHHQDSNGLQVQLMAAAAAVVVIDHDPH